jgi:hypothetical protein
MTCAARLGSPQMPEVERLKAPEPCRKSGPLIIRAADREATGGNWYKVHLRFHPTHPTIPLRPIRGSHRAPMCPSHLTPRPQCTPATTAELSTASHPAARIMAARPRLTWLRPLRLFGHPQLSPRLPVESLPRFRAICLERAIRRGELIRDGLRPRLRARHLPVLRAH